jgi:hypothetical protein
VKGEAVAHGAVGAAGATPSRTGCGQDDLLPAAGRLDPHEFIRTQAEQSVRGCTADCAAHCWAWLRPLPLSPSLRLSGTKEAAKR